MGDKLKEIFRNIKNGWNRFKEAITGKSSNELLESGDEVNSIDKKSSVLRGDENLLKGKETKKSTPFQGFKEPNLSDLREESGEETPHNPSNGEVSEQRLRGTLIGNNSQNKDTGNGSQEASSFRGFTKPEVEGKDTDEPEL